MIKEPAPFMNNGNLVGPITYARLIEERRNFTERIAAITLDKDKVTDVRDNSQTFVDQYQATQTSIEASIVSQKQLIATQEQAMDAAVDALNKAKADLTEAKMIFAEADDEATFKAQMIVDMKDKLADLKSDPEADPEKIAELEAKIAQEEAELVTLQTARNVAQANLQSADAAYKLADQNAAAADSALAASNDTLSELESQKMENLEMLTAEEANLANANAKLADITSVFNDITGEYSAWSSKNQGLIDKFELQDLVRDNGGIIRQINPTKANNRKRPDNDEVASASKVMEEVIVVDLLNNMSESEIAEAKAHMQEATEKSNFPTAEEAREATLQNIWGMHEVQGAIEVAMNAGAFEAEFDSLEDNTIWGLQSKGYHVYSSINSPSLGQSKMVVSWAKLDPLPGDPSS